MITPSVRHRSPSHRGSPDIHDNHPHASDSRFIVALPTTRHNQDMRIKESKYRESLPGIGDFFFNLEYDAWLRLAKVRSDLINALIRGSTHIQRAMTHSAGLIAEPQWQRAMEPGLFQSSRNLIRSQGRMRRRKAIRTFRTSRRSRF
jgi:hypothetical protein